MKPMTAKELCEQAIDRFCRLHLDGPYGQQLAKEVAVAETCETAVLTEEELETIWGIVDEPLIAQS